MVGFTQNSEAQFFKKLAKKAKEKINREAENRSEKRVNKQIDKEFDAAEDTIDGKNKKKKDSKKSEQSQETTQNETSQNDTTSKEGENNKKHKPNVVWSKFDFVPGDIVIFEDLPSTDEENGEFPSRWDLVKGQVEIAEVDGENIIMFIDGSPEIVPYLKNVKEDYLPEVFTIEFDFYKPENGNRISVYLFDTKNQQKLVGYRDMYMDISGDKVSEQLDDINGIDPKMDYKTKIKARWIHISIAYTKGKLKVYMDDTRVINIPHYSGNPTGLTIQAYWADLGEDKAFYFKNIRIAKGGVKYYDRVLSDGKIIVNGIKFDINNATLKPESMGPINKIYKLMKKNPDLNFSVEGHTDADGSDETNMTLSKKRGKTVMDKLISMGIDSNRLKYDGYGESKPLDNNNTPEGKANNRRVEFVKF
jgi:outer membrane protein OmpA-like peptidoglycan-associated protein